MQKFKVDGQLVPKIEWKQTDGQTGRWTDGGERITSFAIAIGNNGIEIFSSQTVALCHLFTTERQTFKHCMLAPEWFYASMNDMDRVNEVGNAISAVRPSVSPSDRPCASCKF